MSAHRRPYIPSASELERRARIFCEKPGLYAVRLVKGGSEVALRIVHEPPKDPETGEPLDRSFYWSVFENGLPAYGPDLVQSPRLYIGRALEQWEYDFIIADRAWARENAPHSPEADPYLSVNLRTAKPVF